MIFLSGLQLIIDNPLNDPNSAITSAMTILDASLTFIFTLEAIMKILANGFLMCGSNSYIRSPWNLLDLLVVLFSVIFLFLNRIDSFSVTDKEEFKCD